VALLEPGEPVDSPRVVRTVGPNVMASVYRNPASDLEALLRTRGGDAICATCLVGTAETLVEQVRELERQGLQELMFAIGVDEKWRVAEAFARGVIARV